MKFLLLLSMVLIAGGKLHGVEITTVAVEGKHYTVCRVDLDADKLQLFLNDGSGKPLKSFDAIVQMLAPQNQKLIFAMNAGMFHPNHSAVGLFVSEGKQTAPLNLEQRYGNFFLKPNGVFYTDASGAHIAESEAYSRLSATPILATQSGPMLVIDGKIHPAFQTGSESRLYRNGVGIVSARKVVFVISEDAVNFYEFATFFRDALKCKDALFFDGTVSSLYAPELHRDDKRVDLGPIIGVVSKQ